MEAMRLGVVLMLGSGVGLCPLWAQDCSPAAPILPTGTLAASLDSSSCLLTDGTAYAAYRLDLPARGQIRMDLTGATADLLLTLRDASGARVDSGAGIRRAIEAGSYILVVNGRTPGQAGPYTVITAFTAEPGMLCSTWANIGRRQTVNGALGASGCLALDGTPYEAYTLTTRGSGSLTITASSVDFTPVVLVRSGDGRALVSSSSGTLSVAVGGDSRYAIVVSSADKTGAYQITTAFQEDDEETCRSTKLLALADGDNGADIGAITADSCYVTIPGNGDQSYYNYYDLTVSTAGLVDLSAVSGDFTPTLYLLDGAGNVMAIDSAGGGRDQNNVQSSLRTRIAPGSYTLQVFSDVQSGGKYSFKYSFRAGNPQPCAPLPVSSPVNPGDPITGKLSAESCRTSLGPGDLYSFLLPASGTLNLDMSALDFNTVLGIRDSKDNLVVRNDEVNGVTGAHITADLPAGAYTVVAASTAGAGSYRISWKFTERAIPPCAFAQTLDINGGYIQRLGPFSCRAANGQPVDYYQFTLPSDAVVVAVVTSREIDGFVTLLDSAGNVLRSDDNSYGQNDAAIVQYLPAGVYKLAARDASSRDGGLYEIDVRTGFGPRPPFCTPKGTLALDGSVTGAIDFSGCQYSDATFADLYRIDLTSDTRLDLSLVSNDFDAYLVLLDAKGNLVDEDDDSGGNTNARITPALPAGTYYAVVKPFGDYTAHGRYTLQAKHGD